MAIWQAETDSSYKSLAYDNERHARFLRLYERGELPSWSRCTLATGPMCIPILTQIKRLFLVSLLYQVASLVAERYRPYLLNWFMVMLTSCLGFACDKA